MEGKNKKEHAKMPPSQRAKQFLPFDAVAGLSQALKAKEQEMGLTDKADLSPEEEEDINEALLGLAKGDEAEITFFDAGEVKHCSGTVMSVDPVSRVIVMKQDGSCGDGETVIKIDDVLRVK